jgi:hypothetical protein
MPINSPTLHGGGELSGFIACFHERAAAELHIQD